jgi:hypothetical protein
MNAHRLAAVFVFASACAPPPPAPVGLDESTRYLIREFYADDAMFQAGVQGFVAWFEDEGVALLGERADAENTDSFTVGDLEQGDIDHLPIEHGRDPADAAGVVSLADMDCDLPTAEDLLLRVDQNVVFDEDWTSYQRTFVTPRAAWQDALVDGNFAPIRDTLDPLAADYDRERYATSLLLTENLANPEPTAGGLADLDEYPLYLHFRHGSYDIDGVDRKAFLILSYNRDRIVREGTDQALDQSYTIEINVERDGGTTLRMLAVWTEIEGGGLSSDNPLVLNMAVNKSLNSSERLSEICAGILEIPAEP